MATEQIIIEYIAQVEGMKVQLRAVEASLKKVETTGKESAQATQKHFETASSGIKEAVTGIAGALGLAFGVAQIVNFGKEAVALASKAEGIKRAFASLNDPKLLDQLRVATKGTVSDLELMKSAVKANNFKLPLDQLAGLFKFAAQRATETGESVEYLTESIVLGISRKSIPILDNLGISAIEIQKEFQKTGDFAKGVGNIVERELGKQGDLALTTADKLARISVAYENIKESIGVMLIENGNNLLDFFDSFTDGFDKVINQRVSGELAKVFQAENDKIIAQAKQSEQARTQLVLESTEKIIALTKFRSEEIIDEETGLFRARNNEELKLIDQKIRNEQKLNSTLRNLNKVNTKELTEEEIKAAEELAKSLRDLRTASIIDEYEREKQLLRDKFEDDNKIAIGNANVQKALREKLNVDLLAVDNKFFEEAAKEADKQTLELEKGVVIDQKKRIKAIEDANKLKEKLDKQVFDATVKSQEDANAEAERLYQEDVKAKEKAEAEKQKIQQAGVDFILNSISAIQQIQQNSIESEISGINEKKEADISALDEQLKNKIINQDDYERKKSAIEEKARKKEGDIKRKQFELEKQASIIQAIINTAVAVAKAAPVIPLMVLAALTGATQIAVIQSQPTPKFAKGVVGLKGKGTGTSDSIHAMLSNGESVVTSDATRQYSGLLQAMNKNQGKKYIEDFYIAPILKAQMKKISELKDSSFASNIANSLALNSNFKDGNLLDSLKQSRKAERENFLFLVKSLSNNQNKRNW